MNSGFTYLKNCFYIVEDSGLLSDSTKFRDLLIRFQYDTVEEYEQAIAFRHEMNHYIQDLSIAACITEGFFIECLTNVAKYLSYHQTVRFPLSDPDNRKENLKLRIIVDDQDLIDRFYKIYDVYYFIYKEKHEKPNAKFYAYSEYADRLFKGHAMSYKDIIEFYAFHKSYWDFFVTNQDTEHAKVLHEVVQKNEVYPTVWREGENDNGRYETENLKRHIKWQGNYQLLNFMTLWGLNYRGLNAPYLDYCENEIPFNYNSSPASLFHSQQRLIVETALHIPSADFILSSLEEGKYKKEDFSPIHRFYKIIKDIRDYNGYPDNKEGEKRAQPTNPVGVCKSLTQNCC